MESELLEARERHIQEAEAHSALVSQLQRSLEEAQSQAGAVRQQQQSADGERAGREALQQECEELRARLHDAEAQSLVRAHSRNMQSQMVSHSPHNSRNSV